MNRNVDNLGRIVIPKEIRKLFGIKENDSLRIETENNKIILYKDCNNSEERIDKAIKQMNKLLLQYSKDDYEFKELNSVRNILKGEQE